MRIAIVAPVSATSTRGNGATARRWQGFLQGLGYDVEFRESSSAAAIDSDVLIALHARKSAAAIAGFRDRYPARPIILAMTGTDLNEDLPDDPEARASVTLADRIVVLYPGAEECLDPEQRHKAVVIRQSAQPDKGPVHRAAGCQICVLAHLREVKDPLCAARAVARLPPDAGVRVVLAGHAVAPEWEAAIESAQRNTPAFQWVGELTAPAARGLLRSSHAMVISSRAEGGANVVSEAIAHGVPILATEIPGNVGLLGPDYPGYFPVGDDATLATQMTRVATAPEFLPRLTKAIHKLQPLFTPAHERTAWSELLDALLTRPI